MFPSSLETRLRAWWLRRLPSSPSLRLTQGRIYLLPTRFGASVLLSTLALWVLAVNYALSLAYALAFWVLALLLVCVLLAFRQLAGLNVDALHPAAVFAGDDAVFPLRWVEAQGVARQLSVGALGGVLHPVSLAPRQTALWPLPLAQARRGRHRLPVLYLESRAPFGLVRAFAYLKLEQAAVVYPRPQPDSHRSTSQGGDEEPGRHRGDDEFSHLIDYLPGSPPSRIAWKVMARREQAVIRHYSGSEGGGEQIFSWWDYAPAHGTEERLSRLCWRVLDASRRGQRFRLLLPGSGKALTDAESALLALAEFGDGA